MQGIHDALGVPCDGLVSAISQSELMYILLGTKCFIWLFCTLPHTNNTIINQGVDIAEGMDCSPKMTPTVYKRVRSASIQEGFSSCIKVIYRSNTC